MGYMYTSKEYSDPFATKQLQLTPDPPREGRSCETSPATSVYGQVCTMVVKTFATLHLLRSRSAIWTDRYRRHEGSSRVSQPALVLDIRHHCTI